VINKLINLLSLASLLMIQPQ